MTAEELKSNDPVIENCEILRLAAKLKNRGIDACKVLTAVDNAGRGAAKKALLTIKNFGEWDGAGGIEELAVWGVDPLIELTNIIDREIEEEDMDCGSVFWLNRAMCSWLLDLREGICKMADSYNEMLRKNEETQAA